MGISYSSFIYQYKDKSRPGFDTKSGRHTKEPITHFTIAKSQNMDAIHGQYVGINEGHFSKNTTYTLMNSTKELPQQLVGASCGSWDPAIWYRDTMLHYCYNGVLWTPRNSHNINSGVYIPIHFRVLLTLRRKFVKLTEKYILCCFWYLIVTYQTVFVQHTQIAWNRLCFLGNTRYLMKKIIANENKWFTIM